MADVALFGNRIPPACKYCENAYGALQRDGNILCVRRGVVAGEYRCGRYRYDPTKRIPKLKPRLTEFKESDFAL
jgi:hypothetical protein